MSQVLTLELSDEVYAALKQQVEIADISLAEWVVTSLERQCGLSSKKLQTEAEKEAARQRFRRHAGTKAIALQRPIVQLNEADDD